MDPYTVADHVVDRPAELGVDQVVGVPGDYSPGLLDHIVRHRSVTWTGTTDELNAALPAAFGAAGPPGVRVTTVGAPRAAPAGPPGVTMIQAGVPRGEVPGLPATPARVLGGAPR